MDTLVRSLLWTRNTYLLLSSVLETSHLKRIRGEQIKKILCRHIYEVLTSSTIASLSLVCESWRLVVRADWVPALRAGAGASVWRELTEPVVTVRASLSPISDTWSQWRPLILFKNRPEWIIDVGRILTSFSWIWESDYECSIRKLYVYFHIKYIRKYILLCQREI